MKPLHIGLLVVGAALAGGLAVKMTEPLAIPQAHPAEAPAPASSVSPPAARPTAVIPPKNKPSPIPAPPELSVAEAPQAVYVEPASPANRKNKQTLVATAKPTEWTPVPYKAAPQPDAPAPDPAPVSTPILPRHVTLRAGMTIPIRLDESLFSDKSAVGDTFQASLAEPLVVDDLVIAEKNARVAGRIVDSQRAGRINGASLLELELTNVATSDGQRVAISTDPWTKQAGNSRRAEAEKVGGGAALGAIIGAIAGGGAGAAIGAGAGGVLGAGAAIATRAQSVSVPSETVIRFRLSSNVMITEQQIAGRQ